MSHVATSQEHAEHHDHGGNAKYFFVFIALCVLTSMSFFTYSRFWPWHETPAVGRMFMTAVSCTKAMLVILFFMHVKYEANWKYVLTIPASIMSVFLCLGLVPDIGARVNGLFGYQGRYSSERHEHIGRESDVRYLKDASLEVMHHGGEHAGAAADSEEHAAAADEPATEQQPADGAAAEGKEKESADAE
ncbi:MAG TPA: cytochrome C oxidase subunit IV family protein [Pirellulales bacterium]